MQAPPVGTDVACGCAAGRAYESSISRSPAPSLVRASILALLLMPMVVVAYPLTAQPVETAGARGETTQGAENAIRPPTANDARRLLSTLAADRRLRFQVMATGPEGVLRANGVEGTRSARRWFSEGPPIRIGASVPPFHATALDHADPGTGEARACMTVIRDFDIPPFETERRSRYFIFRYPDPATVFQPPYAIDWTDVAMIERAGATLRLTSRSGREPTLAFHVWDAALQSEVLAAFDALRRDCTMANAGAD